MKTVKIIAISLLVLVILLLLIALFLPSRYRVERTAEISQPVEMVYKIVTDYTLRNKWDPWLEMEPEAETTVTGLPGQQGSSWTWDGEIIGSGSLVQTDLVMNKSVKSSLEFTAPQQMVSDVFWELEESGEMTKATWAFEGNAGYPAGRYIGLFMDRMMGPDFEKGLMNLKTYCETENYEFVMSTTSEIIEKIMQSQNIVSIMDSTLIESISEKLAELYGEIMEYTESQGYNISFQPFSVYHKWDNENGAVVLEAGVGIDKPGKSRGRIKAYELPGGNAIVASHFGPYHTVSKTYEAIQTYIEINEKEITGPSREIYITDPGAEPDHFKWETQVIFPVK